MKNTTVLPEMPDMPASVVPAIVTILRREGPVLYLWYSFGLVLKADYAEVSAACAKEGRAYLVSEDGYYYVLSEANAREESK